MARPIEATPTIKGKYAKKLIEELTGKRPAPTIRKVDLRKIHEDYLKSLEEGRREQKLN